MLCREMFGNNAEILNIETGGVYSYRYALNGQLVEM